MLLPTGLISLWVKDVASRYAIARNKIKLTALLFGSQARGDADADSDIDVLQDLRNAGDYGQLNAVTVQQLVSRLPVQSNFWN